MTGATESARVQAAHSQRQAADPMASVWVAASAGSGKTKVLTDRVLSLLLDGNGPQRLLCLTFTKAAAAEMANRLARRLGDWAVCDDDRLRDELTALQGRLPDQTMARRARALFAEVLDSAGGIKIMTIHAFCQSLLARFPLEAGVAPYARVMEERQAAELLEESRVEVLASAIEAPDGALAEALSVVTLRAHELTFSALLGAIVGERARFRQAMTAAGGLDGLRRGLLAALGLNGDEDPAALRRDLCAGAAFDATGLRRVLAALESGTAKDRAEKIPLLAAWLETDDQGRSAMLEAYAALFFTADESKPIAQRRRATLLNKGVCQADPLALEIMTREAERLSAGFERLNAMTVARANAALFTLGDAVLTGYEKRKSVAGLLDYDDLILRAKALLNQQGGASWVLFKLDGGLDHLLIDEGQDTNPEQWSVIQAITEEFFTGEGAIERPRTVFVVGDAKQSIYSFQRADPRAFAAMRDLIAARVSAAEQAWRKVELAVSFRSAPAVLDTVDAVFARDPAGQGVLFGEAALSHIAFRADQAGLVELWPAAPPAAKTAREAWSLPLEENATSPAHSRLAKLIARRIWQWTLDPATGGDCQLAAHGRRIQPEDILILVRRRNVFFEEVVRELKLAGVPVAGVDRMVLIEQIAVMDLIALGRAVLLPEDDLTLATVLKGPLMGVAEDELFDLAHGRAGSLLDALRARAADADAPAAIAAAWARLGALRSRADYQAPFEFFATLLGPESGRERLLARLGPEAMDPIEEFLSQALAYGRDKVASLEGFLHWIENGAKDIKRDLEQATDSVRVMTVHGAKGLQAPIVILPDSLQEPQGRQDIYWLDREASTALPFWPLRRGLDGPLAEAARDTAKQAQDEEYRRLLYVAMTRAEDRLYICGWEGNKAAPANCWYNLVKAALSEQGEAVDFDFTGAIAEGWAGSGWRLANAASAPPDRSADLQPPVEPHPPLPDWCRTPPAPEPAPPTPLAPSRPSALEPAARSPLAGEAGALFRRGLLIHRLLQDLPELDPNDRRPAGSRLLAATAADFDEAAREALLSESLAVIEAPEHAALFGPSSRAEVPLVGVVESDGGPRVISGRVDRLAITAQGVWVVDYKTSRPVPADASATPRAYLLQLADYQALLRQIYPDLPIHCGLLWTDGPRFMHISPALLTDLKP